MLVEAEHNKNFLNEFNKKFKSFCSRAPVLISYNLTPIYCHIVVNQEVEKRFILNYSQSVFNNIWEIKEWLLEEVYPVMDEYLDNDLLLEWRIEKIVPVRDQIIIRNLETNKCFLYKMGMPITIFLKKFREGKYTPSIAYDIFKNKSDLITEL